MKFIRNFKIGIRGWLAERPLFYDAAQGFYRRFRPESQLYRKLRSVLSGMDEAFFLQIGSNDGMQGDPLREYIRKNNKWRGIFVEPVPFVYKRLLRNYNHSPQFIFENAAITQNEESLPFFYLPENVKGGDGSRLPYWYDQIGSFDRDHILRHCGNSIDSLILQVDIPCISLKSLLDKHDVCNLDIVHIDAEGSDFAILSKLDIEKYHPRAILFESKHMSQDQLATTQKRLRQAGYEIHEELCDTLAVLIG